MNKYNYDLLLPVFWPPSYQMSMYNFQLISQLSKCHGLQERRFKTIMNIDKNALLPSVASEEGYFYDSISMNIIPIWN